MADEQNGHRVIGIDGLDSLIAALSDRGHEVIGPTVRDGAVDLLPIRGAGDLPRGIADEQEAGHYRLKPRTDGALFGFSNGPSSWKRYLHPPNARLWSADLGGEAPVFRSDADAPRRAMAFLGVRACDLAAIAVLDTVLGEDEHYRARRRDLAIVAVDCGQAGATCFCASMETGPAARSGFDIALTELVGEGRHEFLARAATPLGEQLLAELPSRAPTDADFADAAAAEARARAQMGRTLETNGLREDIAAAADSPRWQEVAGRCLTCGNCTMVCPTCFCTEMADTSDLSGNHAERWRSWESCFTLDFSFAMGGSVRSSAASRYRQWLTHKLSTWVDQFGSLGCVGCGRCIAWCPVGIDITAEAVALRERQP